MSREKIKEGNYLPEPVLSCFILCDRVLGDGGKFNIIGVFYRIHAAGFSVVHRCSVIVGWFGSEGYYDFGLKFLNPAKTRVLLEVPFYPYLLTTDKPYHNAVLLAKLPIMEEGVHWFEVYRGGRKMAEFPLYVLVMPATSSLKM